ncbi:hypothetical protein [Actinospongicola halichondriae]|uniref:hypothetical protein n=1 Tax=Actinospongicola halichondriae TaxID=3236844 RepID=UPI003D4419C4
MGKADTRVVFLETEVAEELLELVDDEPGEADEALLDDAAEALVRANGELEPRAQQAVARGEAVAVGLGDDEVESLKTLIETNTESDKRTLKSVARSLQSKLKAARKKSPA